MTPHKTSAKCPKEPPRRVIISCPFCTRKISLQPSEYRRRLKKGDSLTCSRSCGQQLRRERLKLAAELKRFNDEPFPNGAELRYSVDDYNREILEAS